VNAWFVTSLLLSTASLRFFIRRYSVDKAARMHILHSVGARPNFMKTAPIVAAFDAVGIHQALVHSGQHYDRKMSDILFEQLSIRKPDVNLEVGSGSHAQQTATSMMKFEPIVIEHQPDLVLNLWQC